MEKPRITISELLKEQGDALKLRVLAGKGGLNRYLDRPRVQKPSFALMGFTQGINPHLLQVMGKTALDFLATQPEKTQRKVVHTLFDLRLAAVVITLGQQPPKFFLEEADRTQTPLLSTSMETSDFMTDLMLYLSHKLAPRSYQHGVFMDVFGLGVLITGASGIGKSEIALELITRGHRLVADDMVEITKEGPDILVGKSPESLRYHMEIRGLGILNVRDLFGAASLTDSKRIGLVAECVPWKELSGEERMLGEERITELFGVKIAKVLIPIRPGRSLAVLVEIAARNHLLKVRGIDSSKAFMDALQERIRKGQT